MGRRASFDGETFDRAQDGERLETLLERVRRAMTRPMGREWTLAELRERCGGTEASVSARVRDLRKPRFGGLNVQRRREKSGLWLYRVDPPEEREPRQEGLFG